MEDEELNSYDKNFLDSLDTKYNQFNTPKNKKLANTNAFDSEIHRVNFDSSKQEGLREGINPFLNQFVDLNAEDPYNEIKASNQSGGEQLIKGLGRATSKALTEVAKLPAVLVGSVAAPFAEDGEGMDTAFNNFWIKSLDEIHEKINTDLLPVYTAKAVSEGNLWDNVSSSSFWATDGADGIGFVAAMLVPGAIFQYAGLGGKLINSLSKSSKLAKYTSMAGKAEEATTALKFMGISGKNIDSGMAVFGNTIFEAGAEAKGVGDDLDSKKEQFINNYIEDGLSLEEAEKLFAKQRSLAMKDTFLANTAILLGPNAIMHKAIWGKAAQKFEKTTDNLITRAGNMGKRFGAAFASEGFWEEGSQTTVENMYVDKAMNASLGKNFTDDASIGDFTKEYVNTISSVDGQKAIFLGGIIGGPMMSYQGRKRDVANRNSTNLILDNIDKQITNFNTTLSNDIYEVDENGKYIYERNAKGQFTSKRKLDYKKVREVVKALNYTEQQSDLLDLAIESGNVDVVEKIKQDAIFNLITPAIFNGEAGLTALEQKLNTDSKFNELIERDVKSDEKNKTKTFVKETLETAKYLQEQNEKFTDFSKDVIQLENENATPEQKTNFLNNLNLSYLNSKHVLRQLEKNLKTEESKRNNILEELGLESNLQTEDELVVKAETNNELLKQTNDKIREIESEIKDNKTSIANIWQGKLINDSFNDFVKKDEKESKEVSEEKVQEAQEVLDTIKSFEDEEELKKYFSKLPQSQKDNHIISEEAQEQFRKIKEAQALQKQINEVEALDKDKQKFDIDSVVDTNTTPDTKESVVENNGNTTFESIQTSDTAEVNKFYEIVDKDATPIQAVNEATNPLNVAKNQGAARLISTNSTTGLTLFPNLENFVKYEKEPRDKTNDRVSFSVGDINPKNESFTANEIYKRIKKGETITGQETDYVARYLPINVTLSNKGTSATTFIDSMSSKSPKIVEIETLPLRKNIINALIENKGSFDGIVGKVNKQFTGVLTLGEQGSNVLELDVFKNMSEEDKIKYFKQNTVYVTNKGEVKYTANKVTDNTKILSSSNKGEVFLKIPMLNGQMFYLKLNVSRLSDEKASSTLDLIILRSNILNKKQEFNIDELEKYIKENTPSLLNEFNFVKNNNDSIDVTLEKVINFVVFSQNTNAKTKLILGNDGKLVLGELLHKVNSQIPEWSGQLESYTYTTDSLNNLDSNQKQAIIEYLKYKRHNVLITKDNSATFNNNDYIKYLLGINSDYAVLTTNAVVNEPTFQGYSNIYLDQSITNKKAKLQPVAEETKEVKLDTTEDLLGSLEGMFGDDVVTTTTITSKSNITAENLVREMVSRSGRMLTQMTIEEQKLIETVPISRKEEIKKEIRSNEMKSEVNSKALTQNQTNLEILPFVEIENIDEMFEEAVKIFIIEKEASANLIQRRLSLGYNRAGRILEQLEAAGVISEFDGSKSRKVLISDISQISNFINSITSQIPTSNTEVKTIKSDKLQDIFKTTDAKTKAKIVMVIAKQLGMADKVDPKDMESSFNELYKQLKDNESLQQEIKKICGL